MSLLEKHRVSKLLESVLAHEPASPERAEATARLKQLGRRAVPHLIRAFRGSQGSDALVTLLRPLVDEASLAHFTRALGDPDPRVVAGVTRVLAAARRYDPNSLLDLFADPQIPKAALVEILVAHKESVKIGRLLSLLDAADKEARAALFRLVDQVATVATLRELVQATRHEDLLVRVQLARTLGRFPVEAARDCLVRLLEDADRHVRQVALDGLAQLRLPVEAGALCRLLRDPDITVQGKAIEAIAALDPPHVLRNLLEVLHDESEYVRRAAVEVLNAVGTESAVDDLRQALRDRDWWVRSRSADALARIGGEPGGGKVIEAVLPLVGDDDSFVRRNAIEILIAVFGTTRDERAFGALVGALADPDWWVQERAVDALAKLGDPRAVPPLLRLLEANTPATAVVLRALGALGDPRAVRALLVPLRSPLKAVRKEALRSLAAVTDVEQAALVEEAVDALQRDADEEVRAVADGVLQTLAARYGDRRRLLPRHGFTSGPTVPSLALRSLLHASGQPVPAAATAAPADDRLRGATPVQQVIDAAALQAGDLLADRYRVKHHVGKGGFGTVVLVEDLMVHEDVVLKFLHPRLAGDQEFVKRFIHELRYARKITHEHVIRIHDFINIGASLAISMEYYPGRALAADIGQGTPFPIERGLRIMRDICRGMAAAHQVDVVHRDLKPQNILINDQDVIKIVDFGLAAGLSPTDSRLTRSGSGYGTPLYMAPEQVRGGSIDARTDIYSLGVIMYEMFTGRLPFQGQEAVEIALQHLEGKMTPPRLLVPDMPEKLAAMIARAMAVDRQARYPSMDALRDDIEFLLRRPAP
jgi:serine/threonine-protein kinase